MRYVFWAIVIILIIKGLNVMFPYQDPCAHLDDPDYSWCKMAEIKGI